MSHCQPGHCSGSAAASAMPVSCSAACAAKGVACAPMPLVMTASCLLRMSWHCICHCCTSALASCSNVSCRAHGAQQSRQHNTTCSCEHHHRNHPWCNRKPLLCCTSGWYVKLHCVHCWGLLCWPCTALLLRSVHITIISRNECVIKSSWGLRLSLD